MDRHLKKFSQGKKFKQIVDGATMLCAINLDDEVVCGGNYNGHGELNVPSGLKASVLRCGYGNCCAVPTSGDQNLVCWGYDGHGEVSARPSGEGFNPPYDFEINGHMASAISSVHKTLTLWGVRRAWGEGNNIYNDKGDMHNFIAEHPGAKYLHSAASYATCLVSPSKDHKRSLKCGVSYNGGGAHRAGGRLTDGGFQVADGDCPY